MNAPARFADVCPRCRGRELGTIGIGDGDYRETQSACTSCGGTGTLSPVDVGPDRMPHTLHPYAIERIEWRVGDVLARTRHPSSRHTARVLTSWLSSPRFVRKLGRAGVREKLAGFEVDVDRVFGAYVYALDEHARNERANAQLYYEGERRRSTEAAAHELEQLVDALGGTEG